MAARVLDAPNRHRLARSSVCTTAASSDTRVGTAPRLLSVAARRASLFQRSSAARAPSRSSSNVPPFAHPFGCDILEGFSIRFRRGLFYLVTTRIPTQIDTDRSFNYLLLTFSSGRNSMVECQLPKL